MDKKKSLANIGATVLLSITIAGTSAPMIPAQVYAKEIEPPTDEKGGEYKTSKQEYEEKQAAYDEAKVAYDEACQTTEAETAKLESFEQAYEATESDIDALHNEFAMARESSMKEISSKVDALDKQIETQQEEIQASQAEKDKTHSELTVKNSELNELNSKIEKAEADLANAKDNTEAIDRTKANIEELKNEKLAAENRLGEINSEISNSDSRMESLKSDKASAESELSQIQANKTAKENEINKKNSELFDLEKSEEDKFAEIEAVKGEIASIQSELNNLLSEYDDIKSRYNAAEAEYNRLSELQNEKNNLESTIEELKSEISALETELSEKVSALEANGKTLNELYAEQTTLENELADFNAQKAALEEEIATDDAELAKTIETLNSQKAEYEASLEEAEALLESVGIDYVNELAASYEKNVTSMTIKEYFDYIVANDKTLIDSGATSEANIDKLWDKYIAAFTEENLLKAMDIIDSSNAVRQSDDIAKELATKSKLDGVPILTVGASSMKFTALEAAVYNIIRKPAHLLFNKTAMDVSNQDRKVTGGLAENLAAGYANPVDGWYYGEIENYRTYYNGGTPSGQYGHAENLLNPSYTVTSITYNGRESGQNLYNTTMLKYYKDYSTRTITTDEFRNGLISFKAERETTVNTLTSNIATINKKIAELQSTAEEKKNKLSDVNKSINEKTIAKDTVATKITEASTEKANLESEKANIEKSIADKNASIAENQEKHKAYDGIDDKVDAAGEALSKAYDEKYDAEEKLDNLESQDYNARERLDKLQGEYSEIQEKLSSVRNEISALESEISTITISESTTQQEIDGLSNQISELEKKLDNLKAEQTALNEEITQNNNDLAAAEKSLETLEATDKSVYQAELEKLNSEMEELNTAINNLEEKIANLNSSIEAKTAENQSSIESRKNLESTLTTMEGQNIDSQDLTGDLKDIADRYNAKIQEQEELAAKIEEQRDVVAQATAAEEAAYLAMDEAEDELIIARSIYEYESRQSVCISGPTRYETSLSTADALKKSQGVEKFKTIIVATGKTFADSLAGCYLASVRGNAPIILINPVAGTQQNRTIDYINSNLADGGEVIILGGNASVPATIDSRLNGSVSRLAGSTRYETNIMILEEAGVSAADELLISTGNTFADSLSASATRMPILLVDKVMSETQSNFIEKYFKDSQKKITILGGKNSVSDEVYKSLSKLNKSIKRIAGESRYDTSRLIAKEYFTDAKKAVIAYGMNFPDGLSGGSLAMQLGAPLLLANDNLEVAKMLSNYTIECDIHDGYILGGAKFVTDEATRVILDCLNIVDFK